MCCPPPSVIVVIAGFLSGVGATLMKNGLHMASSDAFSDQLWTVETQSLLWPAVAFAALARLGQYRRWPVAISFPCLLALSVVVRDVYPNGTMFVEGSQEVLVSLEKRVVHVSGIVDPRYIASDNSIDYSKIAEARISYGGTGKVSDAQKPRWGVQLWDKLNPF